MRYLEDKSNLLLESQIKNAVKTLYYLTRILLIGSVGLCLTAEELTSKGIQNTSHFVRVESSSGLFVAIGPQNPRLLIKSSDKDDPRREIVTLSPNLVVVAGERVKESVCSILKIKPFWNATIYIRLDDSIPDPEAVIVERPFYLKGWHYFIRVPVQIRREVFIKIVVVALLQTLINPTGFNPTPELPPWLVEGITEPILSTMLTKVFPSKPTVISPQTPWTQTTVEEQSFRLADLWASMVLQFQKEPPFSFSQLSFPRLDELNGPKALHYRLSSMLFVMEIVKRPGWPFRLLNMIQSLSFYYNWQIAFLKAFFPYFQSILDVEKWWAAVSYEFINKFNLTPSYSLTALFKLDQALTIIVEERSATNKIPVKKQVKLSEVVSYLSDNELVSIIRTVESRLNAISMNCTGKVATLVNDYLNVIRAFRSSYTRIGMNNARSGYVAWEAERLKAQFIDDLRRLESLKDKLVQEVRG